SGLRAVPALAARRWCWRRLVALPLCPFNDCLRSYPPARALITVADVDLSKLARRDEEQHALLAHSPLFRKLLYGHRGCHRSLPAKKQKKPGIIGPACAEMPQVRPSMPGWGVTPVWVNANYQR